MFKARTTKPEKGNKYYITRAKGGYSYAIQGKPTDPDCDVLANCVGYAYGRFNEIGGYGYCKYLSPVDAERFIQCAGGLEVGQTPKPGACMVWSKGSVSTDADGGGHVAIVEKVVNDTQVLTSESGYGSSKYFWTQNRYKGSGNWGMGSAYTFLGFIYNPAVEDESTETCEDSDEEKVTFNIAVPKEPLSFEVGDVVKFTGSLHFVNTCALTGVECRPGKVKILARYQNGYHQYCVKAVAGGGSTAHGWVDAGDIQAWEDEESQAPGNTTETREESADAEFDIEAVVDFTGSTHYSYANAVTGPMCKPGRVKVTAISKGSRHPYHVVWVAGGGSTAYGWVDAEDLKAL